MDVISFQKIVIGLLLFIIENSFDQRRLRDVKILREAHTFLSEEN